MVIRLAPKPMSCILIRRDIVTHRCKQMNMTICKTRTEVWNTSFSHRPQKASTLSTLWIGFQAFGTERQKFLLFKLPSLWYFVTAALTTNKQRLHKTTFPPTLSESKLFSNTIINDRHQFWVFDNFIAQKHVSL